jgi:hypothetical protein
MNRAASTRCFLAVTFMLVSFQGTLAEQSDDEWRSPAATNDGSLVMRVVMVEDEQEDPAAAGKGAAEALLRAMGDVAPKVVLVSECFEDQENKQQLLSGIRSVLDADIVYGGATYGSFTQQGCSDFDSVCLLGIGGDGIGVSAALVTEMGTAKLAFDESQAEIEQRLHAAGNTLARKLPKSERDRLLILIPDAHSPKNRYLVEGVQAVLGPQFPMTGGSVNKNAGQTFVYYRGRMYQDSAVALMLSGDFRVALSGRLGRENAEVIRTAEEGAAEALAKMEHPPIAVLAYNCAGRRGRLDDYEEELAAIQRAIGTSVPLFGCYNAGEIGPLDPSERDSDALCGGSGWHVMFTIIARP